MANKSVTSATGGLNSSAMFSVFISSPSDVRPERLIAARVIERLDREFAHHFRVTPVVWERRPLVASEHFQGPSNIPRPSESEIVVVIMWLRLGVPLPEDQFSGAVSGRRPVTGTEWEFEEAMVSARANDRPRVLFYHKVAAPRQELDLDHWDAVQEQLLQRQSARDFVRRWFHREDGTGSTAAYHTFTDISAFETLLENNLRDLLRLRLPGGERDTDAPAVIWHQGSPYRGLERFEADHAQVFFGRTRARAELRERLAQRAARGMGFVLVIGASGSGKSSLVRAGLIPDLKLPGMVADVALCRVALMRPSDVPDDPVRALAGAIVAALPELEPLLYDAELLAKQLAEFPSHTKLAVQQGLAAAGRAAEPPLTELAQGRLLVFVDQLEELFTNETLGPKRREQFAVALSALAASGAVWVIATMRSDFADSLATVLALAELCGGDAKYLLLPPNGAEIGQIIRQPAHQAGLRFDIDPATGNRLDDALHAAAAGARQAGALPLLQFTLDQLWQASKASKDKRTLTWSAYRAMGELEGAIGSRADAVLASLPQAERDALPSLLRELVSVAQGADGAVTARDVPLARFPTGSPQRRLIEAFRAKHARLLVTDDSGTCVRVAHEALLTHWPVARDQIQKDSPDLLLRARLEQDEKKWREADPAERDRRLLPPGFPLSEALDYAGRRAGELTMELAAYIKASERAEERRQKKLVDDERLRVEAEEAIKRERLEREAERQRLELEAQRAEAERQRAEAGVQRAEAERQRMEAEAQQAEAERQRERATDARRNLRRIAGVAGALAVALVTAAALGWYAERERNQALVQQSHAMSVVADQAGSSGDQTTAMLIALEALGPDGGEGMHSPAAAASLYQAWLNNRETTLAGHTKAVYTAQFSPDGRHVVTAAADGTARVWDVSRPHPTAIVLAGHREAVYGAAFDRDGNHVVTASLDGTARVWDLSTTPPTSRELKGHTNSVLFAAFSPDGRRVVTTSIDQTARVWDISGPQPTSTVLPWHQGSVLAAAFSPDGRRVAAVSTGKNVRVWNLSASHDQPIDLIGHTDAVLSVAFSKDGRLITASRDGTAQVWDLSGPQPASIVLSGHTQDVLSASFSPNGRRAITASMDGTAQVWDLSTNPVKSIVLAGHEQDVVAAVFSPDGRRAATASHDGTAAVWDLTQDRPTPLRLSGHGNWVLSVAFSPDGHRVVTASEDTTARVWNVSDDRPTSILLSGHTSWVLAAAFDAAGKKLVTASDDETALVWDLSGSQPVAVVLKGHRGPVLSAAFSPDGHVVTGSADSTARVWDMTVNPPKSVLLEGHTQNVTAVSFSPDGSRVLTSSMDKTARVWNWAAAGQPSIELVGHKGGLVSASFSRDGKHVVTGSEDKTAIVWDLTAADPSAKPNVLTGHTGKVRTARFDKDGTHVVTASDDGTARLWDISGAAPTSVSLDGHRRAVLDAEFSPDGRRVVTASEDNTARVWDVSLQPGPPIVLTGHVNVVRTASFDSTGRVVVTASDDSTARVWDLRGGEPTSVVLIGHRGGVAFAGFGPHDRWIVTASDDTTTRLWPYFTNVGDLVRIVRPALGRCLTQSLRDEYGLQVTDTSTDRNLVVAPDADGRCPGNAPTAPPSLSAAPGAHAAGGQSRTGPAGG